MYNLEEEKQYLIINPGYKNIYIKKTSINNFFNNKEVEFNTLKNGDVLVTPKECKDFKGFIHYQYDGKIVYSKSILILKSKTDIFVMQSVVPKDIYWVDNTKYKKFETDR